MEAHATQLTGIAVVTAVAVAAGLGLQTLRQPPIVGYILAGIVLGPSGAGLVHHSDQVTLLAELGVVLLLFLIGMELSLKAFVRVLWPASLTAAGQILASIAITFAFGWWLGWSTEQSLLLGFIVAMSSTAVAMKMLDEIGELRGDLGQITIGVLIAQDIAVVPILILADSLGGGSADLGFAVVVKILVAIGLMAGFILVLSRRGKIKLPFDETLRGRVDLLTLATLAVCFAAASVSGIAGLSPAYGAFLAGLMIANSHLRSEAIHVAEPIQSILMVVFFLSIGLLIDIGYVWRNLGLVVLFVIGVVAIKSVLNVWLLRRAGQPWDIAFPGGLMMAQIGEFSFVVAAVGFGNRVLDPDGYRLAIAVIAMTLLITPFWMSSVRRFHDVTRDGMTGLRATLADVYAGEFARLERGAALARRGAMELRRGWHAGVSGLKRPPQRPAEPSKPPEDAAALPQGDRRNPGD